MTQDQSPVHGISTGNTGQTVRRQPITRAEALAIIAARGRMTRHDYMTATGLSRGSADQMFAELQARSQIEPCGLERSPCGRCWRTQFRAIGGAAC